MWKKKSKGDHFLSKLTVALIMLHFGPYIGGYRPIQKLPSVPWSICIIFFFSISNKLLTENMEIFDYYIVHFFFQGESEWMILSLFIVFHVNLWLLVKGDNPYSFPNFDLRSRSGICLLGTSGTSMPSRNIQKAIQNREQDEGVGARVRRSVGSYQVGF